ncbi:MAG: fructose-6-phosphate aldolase [Actinobacteria bacterium]|nr:fructose-6-phosphate aldolase [Actinomycetota bacterium]
MKLFIDTANIEHIREVNSWGILDGVTTNPTLCAKEGRDFREAIAEICAEVAGPVSAEAVSVNREEIITEARELSRIAPNVAVKIPMTTEGLAATKVLSGEGVKVNMTLIFSANQALLAAKVGAAFTSPFVGRIDDTGHDGMELIDEIVTVYDNYNVPTEIIAASIRHPLHVIQAAMLGADIATVPYAVIKAMVKHPLTDRGIESFLKDWEKLQDAIKVGG